MLGESKKALEDIVFPDNIKYFPEHTWIRIEGDVARIGITDYAQDQLGDIIFLELPEVGEKFKQGQEFGVAESAKSVSSLFMPVSGEIIEINQQAADCPEIVNQAAYEDGWMLAVKPADLGELTQLLSKDGYIKKLKELYAANE